MARGTPKLTIPTKTLCVFVLLLVIYLYFFRQSPASTGNPSARYITENKSNGGVMQLTGKELGGDVLTKVLEVYRRKGLVLFSVVNDAYLPMTHSWLCNTEGFGVHDTVVLFTTDAKTASAVKSRWPGVAVISTNLTGFEGDQDYSRAGYVRLMVERSALILQLLEARVRLLLFEMDEIWLGDPVPTLLDSKYKQADVVGLMDNNRDFMCGGFLLVNPTPASVTLWRELDRKMQKLSRDIISKDKMSPVSESLNDQVFLNELLHNKYAGATKTYLPYHLFPDGKWYMMSAEKRAEKPRPLVIHNNWIIGNQKKVERAKQYGHWFVEEGSLKEACNGTAVWSILTVAYNLEGRLRH